MARFKVYGSVEVQVEAWFDADEGIDNRQIEDLGAMRSGNDFTSG